jgi:hypothetical protein
VPPAQAARRQTARPLPEEERQRLRPVPARRARRRPSVGLHSKLATRLIAFGVCVALLAVGRVALSFAVVQKSLETSTVIKQERALRDDNMSLSALVAQQSGSARVQNLATSKFGLVPAEDQVFLRVHAGAAASAAPAP